MKIYALTQIGNSIASNPSHNTSLPDRVLSVMRRHGNSASDEYLKDNLGVDGNELQKAIVTLQENNAVRVVGG